MSELTPVTIYTDGACIPNPGVGGYAAILIAGDHRREITGGRRLTTNNRMEIFAAIAALEALKRPCCVTLYSDSRYLVDAMEKSWARRWRANGWKRNRTQSAINVDLWARLLDICAKHEVTFLWVQGHAGHPENERCDRLSAAAAQAKELETDVGYEEQLAEAQAQTVFFD